MDAKALSIELEHYVTDEWAIDRILEKEILTRVVLDPCAGTGIMAEKARGAGYQPISVDIHNWGYDALTLNCDFLSLSKGSIKGDFTVFMNPPFSKACEFVEKSFELGARKIVMFQRWAFKESRRRREFLEKYPMARLYLCGDRASCFRFDISKNSKGYHIDPKTGKKMAGTTTAHGFFVWERGQEQSNPPCFMLYK